MNDDVAATVIEALALQVRSLEGDVAEYRTQIDRLSVAGRPIVTGECEVCHEAIVDGDRFAVRHAHHNHARDHANQEARTLALEVLARGDTNAATRRRAERIVAATQGAM